MPLVVDGFQLAASGPGRAAKGCSVPSLFDPHNRPVAPGPDAPKQIRFLTADDYPPFEFLNADGALAGFNIDLARAICAELKANCTIQPRRWDNLLDALEAKRRATPSSPRCAKRRRTGRGCASPRPIISRRPFRVARPRRKVDARPEACGRRPRRRGRQRA